MRKPKVSVITATYNDKEKCLEKAAGYDKNDRFRDYLTLYRSLLEE